jgi:phosphatidylserine decarboxylase
MMEIIYFDRSTKKLEKEKVYGQFFLQLLYGHGFLRRLCSFLFLPWFSRFSLLSRLYGWIQKSRLSRYKIAPFIKKFQVDASEFLEPVESFASFNDFFIRKLNPLCRPSIQGDRVAVLPADARYLVFPRIDQADGFWVKGKKFSLEELLQDSVLAQRYAQGALVIARLCPVDYHRFHFPCACTPGKARPLNGPLFSVNPIALKRSIEILSENKRIITPLSTSHFGTVQMIEIGATYVGTIYQTYTPMKKCAKAEEKGYFSFGGSCLILLFEPDRIRFDADLIKYSAQKIEVRGLLGSSLGKAC